jgi:hypothetical protein
MWSYCLRTGRSSRLSWGTFCSAIRHILLRAPQSALRNPRSAIGRGGWLLGLLGSVAVFAGNAYAADGISPKPSEPDAEALAFVHNLLSQRPQKELSLSGVLVIRHRNNHRDYVPVTYAIKLGEGGWRSVYQTGKTPAVGPEQLIVVHQTDAPNQYLFQQISLDGLRTNSTVLTGSAASVSLGGSDFWLSDLGMEFLHWPEQRFVRDAKITMRSGRPCKVLESVNPRPADGQYARVTSWIDTELGTIFRAESWGLDGKRLKTFDLKHFVKVNGRWQVKDMEIEDDKADSRTRLEFNFRE